MKIRPKKAMLIGLAATTLFAVVGCSKNSNETVYGPPPDLKTEDNENRAVYGPPPNLEENSGTTEKKSESSTKGTERNTEAVTEPLTVDQNEPVDVYGPPDSF